MEAKSVWPTRLLALLVLAASLTSSSSYVRTGHNQESSEMEGTSSADDGDGETPESGSRLSAVGGDIINEAPYWLMPIIGTQSCSGADGHLCGFGVRISQRAEYFLASNKAMLKVNSALNQSNQPNGPPGVFKFNAPLEIDTTKNNQEGWQYAPQHVKTYNGDIGLYRVAVRSSVESKQFVVEDKRAHPFPRGARIDTNRGSSPRSCKLLTYGDKDSNKAIRKLTLLPVRMEGCDRSHVCRMQVEKRGGKEALCGDYSDLGAPVVCGEGERLVRFIAGSPGPRAGCIDKFNAVEVAGYINEINQDIEADASYRIAHPTEVPKERDRYGVAGIPKDAITDLGNFPPPAYVDPISYAKLLNVPRIKPG